MQEDVKSGNQMTAICIPAHNNYDQLRSLLESIYKQTEKNWIVCIADDSPTDYIGKKLEKDGVLGKRVFYYRHENKGTSNNTNEAIKMALKHGADYIKVMHQDDSFSTLESLEKMVDALENDPSADILFTADIEDYPGRQTIHDCTDEQLEMIRDDYRVLYRANWLGAPSVTLHRVNAELYDGSLKWLLDVDFYLRILNKNSHFVYLHEPLITIGHYGDQLTDFCTSHPELMISENIRVYRKYPFLHDRINTYYLFQMIKGYHIGKMKKKIKRIIGK